MSKAYTLDNKLHKFVSFSERITEKKRKNIFCEPMSMKRKEQMEVLVHYPLPDFNSNNFFTGIHWVDQIQRTYLSHSVATETMKENNK